MQSAPELDLFTARAGRRPIVCQLRSAVTADDFDAACRVLDLDPVRVLRDPVAALPLVASCELAHGSRFLRLVLTEPAGAFDLYDLDGQDLARLYLCSVFVLYVDRFRRTHRAKRPADVRAQGVATAGVQAAAPVR